MALILVVEDETNIREEIMDWLLFEGYEVVGAGNGREALEAIAQAQPNLIISDIRMPVMDGRELLLEIRSNPSLLHIPFIFLTASAERESMRHGMNIGADDYLTKPFTHVEVLEAVRARLQRQSIQSQQLSTQLNNLQKALGEEREKRLLKSRLVAMFSHDFRNPLASVLSSSGILRNYSDHLTPERRVQHLDRIDGAIHQLLQMLDEMLMIAEMEGDQLAFAPQTLPLATLVEEMVQEFQLIDENMHRIVFSCDFDQSADVDPKLMRHIIANLLSNALKYSPLGTQVTVTLKQTEQDTVCLSVQDEGIGIPPEDLPHLFEPFQRASNVALIKGTGLGLAILKVSVEQHSGRVEVYSTLNQGTRFEVTLPLRQAALRDGAA